MSFCLSIYAQLQKTLTLQSFLSSICEGSWYSNKFSFEPKYSESLYPLFLVCLLPSPCFIFGGYPISFLPYRRIQIFWLLFRVIKHIKWNQILPPFMKCYSCFLIELFIFYVDLTLVAFLSFLPIFSPYPHIKTIIPIPSQFNSLVVLIFSLSYPHEWAHG